MQRIEYESYGGPDVMHLATFALAKPATNEMVIRVSAASINPMDWKLRNGDMKMVTGLKFPRGMGTDFSGIVESVGDKVNKFKPGDAVVGTVSMKASGAFAPKLITAQDLVVAKPDNLSFAEASAIPIAGVTAWLALVRTARLERGQRLFINGATGAVGRAASAIASGLGATVIGRVGPRSAGQAQALGLNQAIDYTKALPIALNKTFDVVFDTHGSLSPQESDRLIKPDGKIIDIVPTPRKFLRALVSRSRKVVIANMDAVNLQPVIDLAEAGKLTIPIAKTVSLEEAIASLESLERGNRLSGKVIITFPEN